ncbi:MAG TPA: PH domain-containing protein [Tepidisphaeraceae bacterium]|nr:PH domain-containing protein [Tepidisphaeraceae bacterium]
MAEADPSGNAAENRVRGEEQPHKPADDREEVYYQGPPSLRGELGTLMVTGLIAAVLVAVPIVLWVVKGSVLPIWAGLVTFLVAIIVVAVPILITRTTRYRVSNYRIDYERGVLSKQIDTLELWHVEDIQFHQSLLERILGVGTISVISHDETTPKLLLRAIPNPRPLFESLKQRIIAVKRQRGVIKMDIG